MDVRSQKPSNLPPRAGALRAGGRQPARPRQMYVEESRWQVDRDRALYASLFCIGRTAGLGLPDPRPVAGEGGRSGAYPGGRSAPMEDTSADLGRWLVPRLAGPSR